MATIRKVLKPGNSSSLFFGERDVSERRCDAKGSDGRRRLVDDQLLDLLRLRNFVARNRCPRQKFTVKSHFISRHTETTRTPFLAPIQSVTQKRQHGKDSSSFGELRRHTGSILASHRAVPGFDSRHSRKFILMLPRWHRFAESGLKMLIEPT